MFIVSIQLICATVFRFSFIFQFSRMCANKSPKSRSLSLSFTHSLLAVSRQQIFTLFSFNELSALLVNFPFLFLSLSGSRARTHQSNIPPCRAQYKTHQTVIVNWYIFANRIINIVAYGWCFVFSVQSLCSWDDIFSR